MLNLNRFKKIIIICICILGITIFLGCIGCPMPEAGFVHTGFNC